MKKNPKIYLVIETDYDFMEIYGICSSKKKAESMIEQLVKKRIIKRKRVEIEEHELDKSKYLPEKN